MARRRVSAADLPTPGPWLVRGEAGKGASEADAALGVEPATEEQPGGFPYLIRPDRHLEPGRSLLHVAIGIQRLADARLIAGAPDLIESQLGLLTSPALRRRDVDELTRGRAAAAWALLVRIVPHFEVDPR